MCAHEEDGVGLLSQCAIPSDSAWDLDCINIRLLILRVQVNHLYKGANGSKNLRNDALCSRSNPRSTVMALFCRIREVWMQETFRYICICIYLRTVRRVH